MERFEATRRVARSVAFAYLMALIMAVGSERMFWFWAPGVRSHLEVAGFYAIATASAIALIRRYRVDSWWSLMLVVPVAAYVVEGVITPVLYTGGPFVPFFPVWFTFWHGIMSLAVIVFGVRRLVLDGSWRALTLLAVGLGLLWGVWSSTARLPESRNEPDLVAEYGPLVVLDPSAFAVYACVFTEVLIIGHGLIGFVWPDGGADRRIRVGVPPAGLSRGERVLAGAVLLGAAMWTLAVPWALPMFVAYVWVQVVALRRHRAQTPDDQADLLARLAGRIRFRSLAPLLALAPSAALTYATIWHLDPGDGVLRVVMYSTIAAQSAVGAVVMVRAVVRAVRPVRPVTASAEVSDPTCGIDADATRSGRVVPVDPVDRADPRRRRVARLPLSR